MSRLARPAIVAATAVLAAFAATAPAAVLSRIDYYEEYYPDNNDNLNVVVQQNTLTSDHTLRWQYPVASYSVSNTRAYVDPTAHKLGAQAVSDTSGDVLYAPGGIPIDWRDTNRHLVKTGAYFTDELTVKSAGKPDGTPVRLQVTLHTDGRASVALPKPDPGSTTTDAHGSASFKIMDPATSTRPLAQLYADAKAIQEIAAPRPMYGTTGSWTRTFDSYWHASSNTGDDFGDQAHDSLSMAYPDGQIAEGGGGIRGGITVDTGTVTLFIDTYVGARLDILGGIDTYAYSSYQSSAATMDFLHTMGFDFAPAPGFESYALSLDLASASVPEPATLSLLTLPFLLLKRRTR